VLVVEDDPVNLELITALLEQTGCAILTAQDGEAGIALAMVERPDLILMDLHMPGVTGYEAARRLKADPATARIPIVAITAQAMRGDEAEARAAGCDGYLTKPLDGRAFLQTLRRFLPAEGDG
jgi:two-component system cell cycle response regulator DivK